MGGQQSEAFNGHHARQSPWQVQMKQHKLGAGIFLEISVDGLTGRKRWDPKRLLARRAGIACSTSEQLGQLLARQANEQFLLA